MNLIINDRPCSRGIISLVAILLLNQISIHSVVKAQRSPTCSDGGTETFDKLTGVTLRNAAQIPLFSSVGNTVTAECNNRCRASDECPGFVINYERESCFRVDTNTDDLREDLIPATSRLNYFEKVCLKGPVCEKAWIYERVPGFELAGYDDRSEKNILTRKECQELCLAEKSLPCRSAEYDYKKFECHLSQETRRSQPAAYRATTEDIDYLENQCADEQTNGRCDYQEYPGQDLGFGDLQLTATDKDECQERCDKNQAFICRSMTYFPATSVCRLSGDDNLSAGPTAVATRRGANYYQKAPCVDLSLVCTATSMTVTLNTLDGFVGKMFAVKNPRGCFTKGTDNTETRLTFLYEDPETDCGVKKEERGVFSNTIVIQNHPIIQQKGDRAIKLYCFFEAGEKTVTNSYDVIADTIRPDDDNITFGNATVPTSIVNATAPSPSVVLRIVDSEGRDIAGTRLGQPLFIRIELDGASIFDIFARNLVAKSGLDEEEIVLLDDRGCPSDPVFPGLEKDNQTGALLGKFEAFKFSDTTVVNFEVNVQFCQEKCNPVNCGNDVESYGKRKKRQAGHSQQANVHYRMNPDKLIYDSNLRQDVLQNDTPLRKQIFVDPGIRVNRFTADENISTADGSINGPGIFVRGEFEDGDVVCTTWTMVMIAVGCVIFLVISILIVCVLCIYSNRRGLKERDFDDHMPASARQSMGTPSMGRPSSPETIYHLGPQSGHHYPPSNMSHRNTADYARTSDQTLRSLRTTLRD